MRETFYVAASIFGVGFALLAIGVESAAVANATGIGFVVMTLSGALRLGHKGS